MEKVIGQGAFGKVFKGHWRGADVAVKKMIPELGGDNMMLLEDLEVDVMMRLRHPRIVAFFGAGELIEPPDLRFSPEPRVGMFVILQFAAGGDLTHLLKNVAGSIIKFPWKDRVLKAHDIAEGMKFIHSKGFIHRDLKSENVLLDDKGRCLIADLGLAKKLERSDTVHSSGATKNHSAGEQKIDHYQTNATMGKGTGPWMAPEVYQGVYGPSVDVFSFGCVMYELLTCRGPWTDITSGKPMFDPNFPHLIIKAVIKGERPTVTEEESKHAPDGYVALMEKCWGTNPGKRPSWKVILSELKDILGAL